MFDWKVPRVESELRGVCQRRQNPVNVFEKSCLQLEKKRLFWWTMGSRRMTTRSLSANGGSLNGDTVRGSSRSGGCSYLSNVRPENRSTLCSVIAQLTEETQPSFETTLRSRAVSEKCHVKFSCVVTGKRCLKHLTDMTTLYPRKICFLFSGHPTPQVIWYKDDMQLDRFCGLPKYEIFRNGQSHSLHIYDCSVEDAAIYQASASNVKGIVSCSGVLEVGEMNEFKIHQRYFAKIKQKAEHRCREAAGKENLEPLRPISPDRTQRKRRSTMEAFPSTPSSTEDEGIEESSQNAAAETETRLQEAAVDDAEEKLPPVTGGAASAVSIAVNEKEAAQKVFTAQTPKTPSVKKKIKISSSSKADASGERVSEERRRKDNVAGGNRVDVMEVENILGSDSKKTQKSQKSAANEATSRRKPSKAEAVEKNQLIALPASSKSQTASGAEGKQAAKQEKRVGSEGTKDNRSPFRISTKPKVVALPTSLQRISKAGADVVNIKADSSTGSLLHRRLESAETPRPNRTALPQRPCGQAGDQLSDKEASQANACERRKARPSEAAEGETQMTGDDAAVGLEPPPSWPVMDVQAPAVKKIESPRGDTQVPSVNPALQFAIDRPTQGTWDHPEGSSERNTVTILSTDPHGPPAQSPGGGEGAHVPSTFLQSQVDTTLKSGNGTETQADKSKEAVKDDSVASNEHTVHMDTESVALQNIQHKERQTEMTEKRSPESLMVKPDECESAQPQSTNKLEEIRDFKEIPKPVSKVISIAELLRAQLMALDSVLVNSVPVKEIQAAVQEPAAAGTETETRQQLMEDDRKGSQEGEAVVNIKATLMETDRSTLQSRTPPVEVSPKALLMPPVSETTELQKYHVSVMNVGNEMDALTQVPQKNGPVATVPERENMEDTFDPLTSTDELRRRSGCPGKVSQTQNIHSEPAHQQVMEPVQRLTPDIQLSNKAESGISDMGPSRPLDQCPMEDHSISSGSLQSTKNVNEEKPLQRNSSAIEEITAEAPEPGPVLERRNCVSPVPPATPRELASGARRKVLIPKPEEATEATPAENSTQTGRLSTSPSPSLPRGSPLLQPSDERASPVERRSPLVSRRRTAPDTPAPSQRLADSVCSQDNNGKPAEEKRQDPFKAPQVIRKIRSETFADASGHLKLWCQFFNVLSDSTIRWFKNEEEIAQIRRKAGDETQVNLTIVQTSRTDSGVYRCSITNDYGTDSTDLLLSAERMSLCEDLGVGEEIEMTPLIFSKGVSDTGAWGSRLFGRIVMQESHVGEGCSHKAWRAKVIYGLEPVFESGHTCVIKVPNPISYGGKEDSCLVDRNLETVKQGCKIQNLAREYCKIFSAEARLIESFGPCLEVIPVYLMYRPANPVPYATVEADLTGAYQKYSFLDPTGRIDTRTSSWVEQKCCALQHWIHQWTNGNLLLSRLEGVDTKITNVGISVKSTGHQGLPIEGTPKVFEQFVSLHQCNYFCGLLGLRSLKVMDSLTPAKPKASRSPLLQRKAAGGSCSPQTGRKAAGSPRPPRKAEQEGSKTPTKDAVQ
ncbi:alpha-protein kinase 3-like [Betta splendens]|uniref:non-specific serine/threonine protein kinase n=1 Tax=Betta splendens TaxID=158456 RepID=A0A9W2XP89_BETSP|nr:alpha-protein kinase 3-like [Betta splendens]